MNDECYACQLGRHLSCKGCGCASVVHVPTRGKCGEILHNSVAHPLLPFPGVRRFGRWLHAFTDPGDAL